MNRLRTNARIPEVDGLSDAIVRIYKADVAAQEDAFLKGAMAELEALSADITAALLQDKAVSNLDEADGARDEAIKNLGTLLTGYTAFPAEEKRQAAIALKSVYDKYAKAGITSASYVSESSMTESLLSDLAAEEAKKNIALLDGIETLVGRIRTAQDAFAQASDGYTKAKGARSASASSLKKPLMSIINEKLVPYLNTMALVKNEALAGFSRDIETEIDRVNSAVTKRGK